MMPKFGGAISFQTYRTSRNAAIVGVEPNFAARLTRDLRVSPRSPKAAGQETPAVNVKLRGALGSRADTRFGMW
jgi:hypothetical protein